MKELKQILIVLFLLQSTFSFAQTKEETIKWLKTKITANIDLGDEAHKDQFKDFKIDSLDECTLVFSYTFYSLGEPFILNKVSVPIVDIVGFSDGFGQTANLSIKEEKTVLSGPSRGEITRTTDRFGGFKNGEENLYERLGKAFKHLATFCEHKKEPF